MPYSEVSKASLVSRLPRLSGALLSEHCAVKDHHLVPLSSESLTLKSYPPRLVRPVSNVSVCFVKAESHRSTEEEVEGGRGLLFYANTGCFQGVWIGRGWEGSGHWWGLMRERHQDIHVVDGEKAGVAVQHPLVPVVIYLVGQSDDVAFLEA